MADTALVGDFIAAIGQGISGLVGNAVAAIGNVLGNLVYTIGRIVPGGFPIFVVLLVIAVLVGWSTLRR